MSALYATHWTSGLRWLYLGCKRAAWGQIVRRKEGKSMGEKKY